MMEGTELECWLSLSCGEAGKDNVIRSRGWAAKGGIWIEKSLKSPRSSLTVVVEWGVSHEGV